MKAPIVSVLTPVYNGEKYLREMMDSILVQTFQDFEFIIVNDGSTDNTEAIIKSERDPRIRYFANDKNRGISYSYNRAISEARGKFLAVAEADDVNHPRRLEIQVGFLDANRKVGLVAGTQKSFSGKTPAHQRIFSPFRQRSSGAVRKHDVLFNPWGAWHASVMYRAKVLADSDIKYTEKYRVPIDMGVMLPLSTRTDMVQLRCVLLSYRKHPDNTSGMGAGRNPTRELPGLYRDFFQSRFGLDPGADNIYADIHSGLANGRPLSSADVRQFFALLESILTCCRAHLGYDAELLEQCAARKIYRHYKHALSFGLSKDIAKIYWNHPLLGRISWWQRLRFWLKFYCQRHTQ